MEPSDRSNWKEKKSEKNSKKRSQKSSLDLAAAKRSEIAYVDSEAVDGEVLLRRPVLGRQPEELALLACGDRPKKPLERVECLGAQVVKARQAHQLAASCRRRHVQRHQVQRVDCNEMCLRTRDTEEMKKNGKKQRTAVRSQFHSKVVNLVLTEEALR